MSARALSAELAAVRALVADGLAEIGDAGDTGQVWIRSATARLTALDGVLTEAAGVLATPARVIALTIATFLVVTGSATLAGHLALTPAGTLAVSAAALLIMSAALPRASRYGYRWLGRRRLARAAERLHRPSPSTGPATGGPAGTAAPGAQPPGHGLTDPPGHDTRPLEHGMPERLLRGRVRLVSAALRHVGADNWSAPELRRAIRTDPLVRRLAHADQLLCQAVDCVERHLGDLRKDVR
jgi:hypothetical protein